MDKRHSHFYHSTDTQQHPFVEQPERDPGHGPVLRVTSQRLFAGAHELEITHQGALYRLRQTALGKLILTK